MPEQHRPVIRSLHDAHASCTCGKWEFTATGARTRDYILGEFHLHRAWAERTRSVPALFVVGEATGEAEGTVYHFCDTDCRDQFQPIETNLKSGESDGYVSGSVCDHCGSQLP